MPVDVFTYKPKSTFWVTYEATVEYSCSQKPVVVKKRICGCNHFAFIFGYEDKMDAFVHDSRMVDCVKSDCNDAINYDLEIKFIVYSKIGLGFGIGGFGTGTLGFPTRSVCEREKYETECVCCDSEIDDHRKRQALFQNANTPDEERSAIPLAVTLSALAATAITPIFLSTAGNFVEYYLSAILLGLVGSGIIVCRRVLKLREGIRKNNRNKRDHDTAA